MIIHQSAEDYLETILILSKKLPVVRSVDIANELGYKKSSISIAVKKLKADNLITVTDAGFIFFTEEGAKKAEAVYERHLLFTKWLTDIGVDPKIAAEDACEIEHVLSEESYKAIKEYIKKAGK